MPISKPWYADWEEQCELAAAFIRSVRWSIKGELSPTPLSIQHLGDHSFPHESQSGPKYMNLTATYGLDPATTAELRALEESSLIKMIFESNRLEKAGMDKESTKKLISSVSISSVEEVLSKLHPPGTTAFNHDYFSSPDFRQTIINFGGVSKRANEVIQHLVAMDAAINFTDQQKLIDDLLRQKPTCLPGDLDKKKNLVFREDAIKLLHNIMAHTLLPSDAGVEAGEYRIDARHIGNTSFIAFEKVPPAMEIFCRDANELLVSNENPIKKAARISYDFGAIHPFPDFNGRMSRLLLNMVLRYEGLPFFLALEGASKEKHDYGYLLRRDKGKIELYARLIAKAVLKQFEQLNRNLSRAGLDPIKPA